MNDETKRWLAYLGFALCVVAGALNALGIIPLSIATLLMGVFGYSGVVALRSQIEAWGIKTYLLVGGAGLVMLIQLIGWLTPEAVQTLLAFLGVLTGITIQQALKKDSG